MRVRFKKLMKECFLNRIRVYCILKRNKDIFEDLYCVLLLSGEILDSLNQGLSARYVKAWFAVLVFYVAGSQFALVVKNFG